MDFVIITDSCSDLDGTLREKYNIDYAPMSFTCDEKKYKADLDWIALSAPEFYNLMREGKRIFTSQVDVNDVKERFTKYLEEGKDILYLSCSTALSSSYNVVLNVIKELSLKYSERKMYAVDTLRSCMALGILCITASEQRANGKTIEEVYDWVMKNKLTSNMEATVDSLKYLKQAGRVSAASAFFGGLLNIKPIIYEDILGRNLAVDKVKGRNTSIETLAKRFVARYKDVPHQKVYIAHADCLEDALKLKKIVIELLGKEIDIELCYVGPCVGGSSGPGMLCINYYGEEVTS